jgi:hypothetical protein
MARLPYRHRSENVLEIVRPTVWRRVAPKTRAAVTAVGCLAGTAAAIVLYLFIGLPLLVFAVVATVVALLVHSGKSAERAMPIAPAPAPGGGEQKAS